MGETWHLYYENLLLPFCLVLQAPIAYYLLYLPRFKASGLIMTHAFLDQYLKPPERTYYIMISLSLYIYIYINLLYVYFIPLMVLFFPLKLAT